MARTPVRSARCSVKRDGLLRWQAGSGQRGPFPLREPGPAGAAGEQPDGLVRAVGTDDQQVAQPPLAEVGAIRALAAEAAQILLQGEASVILGRESARS